MSEASPTVSVIMPCYNQGQYLDEAVGSVFAQTYQNFEIIVINDGSTDPETQRLLQDYDKPGVKVIHTGNHGPASARNTGIKASTGKYILPLDADDRIAPTYLEQAVQILEVDPAIGIVYCLADFFGEKTGRFELPEYKFPDILLGNMIFNSSFYRKADWEKVGGYRENFRGWEDYDFWLSLIELGREVYRIPEVLYFYRQIATSRSNSMQQQHWVEDYTRLFHNHPSLYADNIQVLFEHLVHLREDVHQTHLRLHATQIELATELANTQMKLAPFEKYKLVWLYDQYMRLKQRLGLVPRDA